MRSRRKGARARSSPRSDRASPTDKVIPLTNTEFNLLVAFLAAPQQVLSRDELISLSRLNNDEIYDRSIDSQVGRLRRKLTGEGGESLIRTEYGAGYIFAAEVQIVR